MLTALPLSTIVLSTIAWASCIDTTSASSCGKSTHSASYSVKPIMGPGWVSAAWTCEISKACWIFLFLELAVAPKCSDSGKIPFIRIILVGGSSSSSTFILRCATGLSKYLSTLPSFTSFSR
ncbi:hypothetical protein EV2_014257 [Malus domestica]